MFLEVLEGLWSTVINMIVTIPVDNALGFIYVIGNLLLQLFATG